MRLIVLNDEGGEKFRTSITSFIATSDNQFQVVNEDDIMSDVSETIDEAITSLISKIPA